MRPRIYWLIILQVRARGRGSILVVIKEIQAVNQPTLRGLKSYLLELYVAKKMRHARQAPPDLHLSFLPLSHRQCNSHLNIRRAAEKVILYPLCAPGKLGLLSETALSGAGLNYIFIKHFKFQIRPQLGHSLLSHLLSRTGATGAATLEFNF